MKTDAFGARSTLDTGFGRATIYRLDALEKAGVAPGLVRLPFSIKVLLEAVLRSVDGELVTADDVKNLGAWNAAAPRDVALPFLPARVILQDFTGVPAVVDLASMQAAVKPLGADPRRINPLVPVDLVVSITLISPGGQKSGHTAGVVSSSVHAAPAASNASTIARRVIGPATRW